MSLSDVPSWELASADRESPPDRAGRGDSLWERLEPIGEGAASTVWRARRRQGGHPAALKLARPHPSAWHALAREARLLARVGRRWGPALLDAGSGFVASEWTEGEPLDPRALQEDRTTVAVVVAHGVARALEELHQAGVRHGDVKPANVLRLPHMPSRDAADDRGATLIDLGLAAEVGASALGGTPRYAAPELRGGGETGPAADLWALGVLLAEALDSGVAAADDPSQAVAGWGPRADEPGRWVQALLARAPGGRPSASWVGARAACWLGLRPDENEASRARAAQVRRAYLAERDGDVQAMARISEAIGTQARTWLEEAIAIATKLAPACAQPPPTIEPLSETRRARWLVALAGPMAAAWSAGIEACTEGDLVARALDLARVREPSCWTLEDIVGHEPPCAPASGFVNGLSDACDGDLTAGGASRAEDRLVRLVRELARTPPDPVAMALAEDTLARGHASTSLALQLASALLRAGDAGRAWVALGRIHGAEADAMRAEVARRRGDAEPAKNMAERVLATAQGPTRWSAQATLARIAWDAGDFDEAERCLDGAAGAAAAEVRALIAWRRGDYDRGERAIERAMAAPLDADAGARLEYAKGLLDMARGTSAPALVAFERAAQLAARAGAVTEEATYLTSVAAAATDTGDMARALASATRAALLWERLGSRSRAARAWLARAGALATLGAAHAADEASEAAYECALQARDGQAAAYARWARIEVRSPGDEHARGWAIEADAQLGSCGGSVEDRTRAAARLLVWAPMAVDERRVAEIDAGASALGAPARWEWWGARATAILGGRRGRGDTGARGVLSALVALVDVPAPLGSRGPALDAAVRLATECGDGDAARRLEHARALAARTLKEGAPAEHRAALASVAWARAATEERSDVAFEPGQVEELESIVRALSARDGLKPLLNQVLDTMVLWAGVERGLLLLRAPDGRLVPRAGRNLARRGLASEQLALSHTIAQRAIDTGDAVVATDAFSTLGELHASVHALKLRSVLAVPLVARGEALGVVYLDDRVRKGAFGPRELAWVRVVASQAAMAIADARDAVLLRRAVRHAERARARLEATLQEREVELDLARTQVDWARDGRETRYRYDEVAGRSEPMRELLRLVDRVTASEVPLLISGESGTGKELVARAIHSNGPRARQSFVTENCASVPESLLESTLFGHIKGAFTGASSTRAGLFDVADGGTLFLDEIGEMSLGMQAKLLRVVQDGEVRPVGGERTRRVNVRVIGATHRDLQAMVSAGTFREDLYYRLNVITLRVPPLRERAEDIPLLVEHFLRKHAGERPPNVTRGAMARLVAFPWPGNVRQLENEIRRAIVLGGSRIDVSELSTDVVRGSPCAAGGTGLDLRTRIDALEVDLVTQALTRTGGNQTRAARLLGLSRFGLQKMMKRLNVKAPA